MSDTSRTETVSHDEHIPAGAELPIGQSIIVFVAIVASLYFGKDVLVPLVLGLLLAFLLAPLVSLLRKIRLGRVPSVLLGMMVALGVILALGGVIGAQISELSANVPEYVTTIQAKVATVHNFTIGRLTELANRVGVQPSTVGVRPATGANAKAQPVNPPTSPVTPLELAQRYLSSFLSPIGTLGLVLIVAIFALLQQEDLRDRLIRLLGSNDLHRTTLAIDDAGRRLSRYFVTQLTINSVFGIVIGLGLLAIGVPNPVLFGILSGLLRFVPYVGSMISALLPLSLAAAVDPGWSLAIWTGCLYVVIEVLTGQIIEPMTYGHSTGLSPFSVIVAAIFWSWLWGPIGLILSTPLTLCLVVVGRHVKRLEFLDIVLGDRPALTPVESLYQRIFAGDADEAQDHADLMLKEVSLTSYYDAVVIKALQLASQDAQRGALNDKQQHRVITTVRTLIDGLKDHFDHQPAPIKTEESVVGELGGDYQIPKKIVPPHVPTQPASDHMFTESGSVLCIAGRGVFDESASAVLAQLLGKHGMAATTVGYEAVSRESIRDLDMKSVKIICISCVDIHGAPAHLRYLIKRLRQYMPSGAKIVVGFWPTDDKMIGDPSVNALLMADYLSASLQQSVSVCVDIALKEEKDPTNQSAA